MCHIDDENWLTCYHTQEHRRDEAPLTKPIFCNDEGAWLGKGYYFWEEISFARYWGEDCKCSQSGFYTIYMGKLYLDPGKLIDTVYNREDDEFFGKMIKNAKEEILKKQKETGEPKLDDQGRIPLNAVHHYLMEFIWPKLGVLAIRYADTPTNPRGKNRRYSDIYHVTSNGQILNRTFSYKKRIQIVIFTLDILGSFSEFSIGWKNTYPEVK